jgi:hypothetical protein
MLNSDFSQHSVCLLHPHAPTKIALDMKYWKSRRRLVVAAAVRNIVV